MNDQLINISFKTHRRGRVELLKYFIGDLLKNPYNTYFIIAKNLIFSRLAIIHVYMCVSTGENISSGCLSARSAHRLYIFPTLSLSSLSHPVNSGANLINFMIHNNYFKHRHKFVHKVQ